MTSEGLGEMFEGEFANTCAENSARADGGMSGPVKRAYTGSEDPHRRERNSSIF